MIYYQEIILTLYLSIRHIFNCHSVKYNAIPKKQIFRMKTKKLVAVKDTHIISILIYNWKYYHWSVLIKFDQK